MHTPVPKHTNVCTHSQAVPGLARAAGSAAGQHVPLHISVIHPCHSGQDHEGGVSGAWKGRRDLHGLHSTPTLLPSAHPVPLAEANPFLTSTTSGPRHRPLLLQHGSVLKRTHGKGQKVPGLPGPIGPDQGPKEAQERVC